jgi:hypothetical protein
MDVHIRNNENRVVKGVKMAATILRMFEVIEVAFKTIKRKIITAENPNSQSLSQTDTSPSQKAIPLPSRIKTNQKHREKTDKPRHLRISYIGSPIRSRLFTIRSEVEVERKRITPKVMPSIRLCQEKLSSAVRRKPQLKHKIPINERIVFRDGNVKREE